MTIKIIVIIYPEVLTMINTIQRNHLLGVALLLYLTNGNTIFNSSSYIVYNPGAKKVT